MKQILNYYSGRLNITEKAIKSKKRHSFHMAVVRLIIFIATIGLFLLKRYIENDLFLHILIVTCILAFFYLIRYHNTINQKIRFLNALSELYSNQIQTLHGNTDAYPSGEQYNEDNHAFASDLDIFCKKGIFPYLCRSNTLNGQSRLANWLKNPYFFSKDHHSRSQFMMEFSKKNEFREHFYASSKLIDEKQGDMSEVRTWLEDKTRFATTLAMQIIRILFPTAILTLIILYQLNIVNALFIGIPVIISLSITGFFFKQINKFHRQVSEKGYKLGRYADLLNHLEKTDFQSSEGIRLKESLKNLHKPASAILNDLSKLINGFDNRLNIFVYLVGNALFLMDLQLSARLETWKQKYSGTCMQWFETIADLDAFNSFGFYMHDHPDNTQPIIVYDIRIDAIQACHPLLKPDECVPNDFKLQNNSYQIITGANMAGKSTFLRMIAVNYIFAMLGASVCAKEFRFKPSRLFTSMRTADSLSEHESYFYAELKRLKFIYETVNQTEDSLILLDEILKGTNSVDKQKGSRAFIEKLIKTNSSGIIATHDIMLTEAEKDFPEKIANKCFEIHVEGEEIKFDYILREGVTKNMNALILMKNMGLIDK